MFSWRTKEEKFWCLNHRPRTSRAKRSWSRTKNESPESDQRIRASFLGSLTILQAVSGDSGAVYEHALVELLEKSGDYLAIVAGICGRDTIAVGERDLVAGGCIGHARDGRG